MHMPPRPHMTRLDWALTCASGCVEASAVVWFLRRHYWRTAR